MRAPAFPSPIAGVIRTAVLNALLVAALAAPSPAPASPTTAALVPTGSLVEVTAPASGYSAAELAPLVGERPRVVMDEEGGFIVFWHAAGRGGEAAPTIFARRFAADGEAMWAPRPIWDSEHGIGTVRGLDDVAMNGAGDFVVAWIGADGVALRAFDVGGDPLGPIIEVGSGTVGDGEVTVGVRAVGATITDERQLVVALAQIVESTEEEAETFDRVVMRRYDVDGNLLGPEAETMAATQVPKVSVAAAADGSFAVASQLVGAQPERPQVVLAAYSADGDRLVVSPATVDHPAERSPRVAFDAGGAVLLALEDGGGDGPDGTDGSCSGVFARIYEGAAQLQAEARTHTRTEGCQGDPRVAGLADGWLVGWRGADAAGDLAVDGVDHGLYVRRYAGEGLAAGGPVRVLAGHAGAFDVAAGGVAAAVAAILGGGAQVPGEPRVVVQRLAPAGEAVCTGGGHSCFQGGRFRVDADWRNPYNPGAGPALPFDVPAADSEAFWFFRQANLELLVKVLDGRGTNGHFWVFYGSLSTVEFWLTVTDTLTGRQQLYYNPPFQQASHADTAAFPEDTGAAGGAVAAAGFPAAADLTGNGAPFRVMQIPARELAPASGAVDPVDCEDTAHQLCLGGAFVLDVTWTDPRTGNQGVGGAIPLTEDTGAFWFFRASNVELVVKVLDGRPVNGHWWVFYAGLSDVEYTLTVTREAAPAAVYSNEPFALRSGADTTAFDEEATP